MNGTNTSTNAFRSASYTMNAPVQNCVEVGRAGAVAVRDTKQAHMGDSRTVLEIGPGAWGAFLAQIR